MSLTSRVKELEIRESLVLDLVARMLEGKPDAATWGADSAEALIKAISQKYADLAAVPLPKE